MPGTTSNEHCTNAICNKTDFQKSRINKGVHPHQLRHSYTTTLINNGAPLEVIQNLMGHEKSQTTRVYAYLSGHKDVSFIRNFFKCC
ncbi:tyrosine-type recombinase/integrase [Rossellomorea pakistanensis]|uniref:tyrosine-type recombinase/integrase n=1 Tax=Rossellomorea pakistanensis TaxID=992288 RepID=UPI003AEF7F3C